jgi:hypothetical protein
MNKLQIGIQRLAKIRDGLNNINSVFKYQDALIQFLFMNGIIKFSNVSQFAEYLKGVDWVKTEFSA